MVKLIYGDSLEVMASMPENSVDCVVTDPPYGIRFMGKAWDGADIETKHSKRKEYGRSGENAGPNGGHNSAAAEAGKYDLTPKGMLAFQEFSQAWAEQALRVLKPGGYLLSFASTRTYHRMVCGIESAGFEIRDCISWVFGSGFPKSLDISKAIDKAAGAEREVVSKNPNQRTNLPENDVYEAGIRGKECNITAAATEAAKQWNGWGTALKPAFEPICVARKPLECGTVAENVLTFGTGGINIDGCRVPSSEIISNHSRGADSALSKGKYGDSSQQETHQTAGQSLGRFPANLIHDGSKEVVSLFPGLDEATAARFFYCAKASKADRDEGLAHLQSKRSGGMKATLEGSMLTGSGNERTTEGKNHHPTVKPTSLMQWLVRLVCPPGGTVLDPFGGSGGTGKASAKEGFNAILIEKEKEYIPISYGRILPFAPIELVADGYVLTLDEYEMLY